MSQSVQSFSAEAILNRLRGEGLRITAGRRGIIEALFRAGKTALAPGNPGTRRRRRKRPRLRHRLSHDCPVDRLHLVHKVNLQRACSYYELNDPAKHYDHIVCTNCGKVVVIDIPCPLGDTERLVGRALRVSKCQSLAGIFRRCQECSKGKRLPRRRTPEGSFDLLSRMMTSAIPARTGLVQAQAPFS